MRYLILIGFFIMLNSCQTDFKFGTYRSIDGYEYVISPDSTIQYNGCKDVFYYKSVGKADISNRKIDVRLADYQKESKTSLISYYEITNFGLSEKDSSFISIQIVCLEDSFSPIYEIGKEFFIRLFNNDKQIIKKIRTMNNEIMLTIPVNYNRIKLNVDIIHNEFIYNTFYLYDCYNYGINIYYNYGFAERNIHNVENLTFKKGNSCIKQVYWTGLKRTCKKYYLIN